MERITSYTLLQAVARHLSLLSPKTTYTHHLEAVALEAGFRTLAVARARLPRLERNIAGFSVTLTPSDDGSHIVLTSGQLTERITTPSSMLLVAHVVWLLTGRTLSAREAENLLMPTISPFPIPGPGIDQREPCTVDVISLQKALREVDSLLRLEAESYPQFQRASDLAAKPCRPDIAFGDEEIRHTNGIGPAAPDRPWLNALNGFVPPFHDGLPPVQVGRMSWASATADTLAPVLADRLEGAGAGEVSGKMLSEWLRHNVSSAGQQVLRCSDSIPFLAVAKEPSERAQQPELQVRPSGSEAERRVRTTPYSLEAALMGQVLAGHFPGKKIAVMAQFHDGQVVIGVAEKDTAGWWPTKKTFPTSAFADAEAFAEAVNEEIGVTPREAMAIVCSSMAIGRSAVDEN